MSRLLLAPLMFTLGMTISQQLKSSLNPPLFIEVPVPSQESKWSYICVCIDLASLFYFDI